MIKRLSLFVFVLCALGLSAAPGQTITWDQWPYGARYIGGYSKWWMSPDGSHITVPAFNPDDSIWDLTSLGGAGVNRNAESWIMTKQSAQGTPPSQCTFAEKQVQGGQTSWGYEHMDTTGGTQYMWLYGFYTQGTQIDYDAPYQQVYRFPMQLGDNWNCTWTWNYLGVDLVTETRDNYVVARGRVKVQADTANYYPCLVIRTYSTSTDELGVINDMRVVHEWVVPDMGLVGGSVATIQSQNGVTNPNFTDAEHVFRMKEFHSPFDNVPPSFAATTRVPSGYNLGPFAISSSISDPSGVKKDSLYYRVGSGGWQAAGHDSIRSGSYHFHIPALGATDSVRYYLAASDSANNRGTDPVSAPSASFAFYARNPADDHFPPAISNVTIYGDTAFAGPFPVAATVVDSCSVDSVQLIYRFNTGTEQTVLPDSVRGSVYYLTIPSASLNTFVRYKVRAVDGSPNHNAATDPASGYYSFNVVDGTGPTFAGTTELYDTLYAGPFSVQSEITDVSGVASAQLFYKFGSVAWDSLPSDSTAGSTWWFHIPRVTSPMSVRYYLKAVDNSQSHNAATDPAGAPGSYYVFFCDPSGAVAESHPTGLAPVLRLAGVNPTGLLLELPRSGQALARLYDALGREVAVLHAGEMAAGSHRLILPERLSSGSYVVQVDWQGQRASRGFIISR
jgi:hypothetical protein